MFALWNCNLNPRARPRARFSAAPGLMPAAAQEPQEAQATALVQAQELHVPWPSLLKEPKKAQKITFSSPRFRKTNYTSFRFRARAGSSCNFHLGSRARTSTYISFSFRARAACSHSFYPSSRVRTTTCTISSFRTRADSSQHSHPIWRANIAPSPVSDQKQA